MAIALEFIDFVVPISTIRQKYPGGWEQCLRDHAGLIGGRVWYDNYLFRDGAMNPTDIKAIVDRWAALGFETIGVRDGQQVWKDVCVVESLLGAPTLPCDWLVVDAERRTAHLKGGEPGDVVGRGQAKLPRPPNGAAPADSLRHEPIRGDDSRVPQLLDERLREVQASPIEYVAAYMLRFLNLPEAPPPAPADQEIRFSLKSFRSARVPEHQGPEKVAESRGPPPWLLGMTPGFRKDISNLDRTVQGRILTALTELADSTLEPKGDTLKPLSGDYAKCWRYRIGDYRMIFLPDSVAGKISLLAFGARGSIYDD